MAEEKEVQDERRVLSSTPNRLVLPSQRGHLSLFPDSLSIQYPLHHDHVTPAGNTVHFPYRSDLTVFDYHRSSLNLRSVCSLLNSLLNLRSFFLQ